MVDTDKILAKIERFRDAGHTGVAYFPVDEIEEMIFDMAKLKAEHKDVTRALEAYKDTPSMVEMQVALAKENINVAFARLDSGELKAYKVSEIDTTKGGGV